MCPYCQGSGKIIHNGEIKKCNYCNVGDNLITAIRDAAIICTKNGEYQQAYLLNRILSFLPDYPVLAVMEAEELDMDETFIELLRDSFNIKATI